MINLDNLIQGLSRSGAVSGFAGALAGSALAGALAGKKGRKVAKSALKVGALAAVGGLAYTAYRNYRQGSGGTAAAAADRSGRMPAIADMSRWEAISRERFASVVDEDGASAGGVLLVHAMFAAAAADGHMDPAEQERIFAEIDRLALRPEEKAQVFDTLREPPSLADIVDQVRTPETAIEVYAASLVAIDESRAEGRTYLRGLADALELPEALVRSIHTEAERARQRQAA